MVADQAAARIRQALVDNGCVQGFRGPKKEQQHVEVFAADVLAVAASLGTLTETQAALERGCKVHAPKAEQRVVIQADDAFHLIESFK